MGSPLRFTFRRVVDAMSVRLEVSNPDATVCEGRLLLEGWRSDAAIRTSEGNVGGAGDPRAFGRVARAIGARLAGRNDVVPQAIFSVGRSTNVRLGAQGGGAAAVLSMRALQSLSEPPVAAATSSALSRNTRMEYPMFAIAGFTRKKWLSRAKRRTS